MSKPHAVRRRTFLKTAAAGAAWAGAARLGLAGRTARAAPRAGDRPNILFIISDEHNASIARPYGNDLVRTPAFDRLAERGMTFDSFYCNSPLCVPSRMTVTAGKYISRTGAWSNACWLPSDDYPSLARILTQAGYDALLCGKMHYDRTRRYGFTEIGGNMNRSTKTGRGGRRDADNEAVNVKARDGRFKAFHTGTKSSILQHDQAVTAGVLEFLNTRRTEDGPFFLLAGYLAPHFPLIVPEPFWKPYEGKVPMPVLPEGHVAGQPLNYHHLRRGFGVVETDPATVRLGRELYYGLTQWLDDQVGKVLKALAASPVGENTIVVYTSDHGENMGEHHLWWKNCMFEHAARVPLIVSWPKRWAGGQRRTQAAGMVDLVQTVAALAGARTPDDWNGDSLLGWMDDPKADWKDLAASEYYAHNIASGYAMLRQGRHKYVYHTPPDAQHAAERELYDLVADPGEFTNLAAAAEHADRIAAMHKALVAELGRHPDESEQRCRADYAKGYGRVNPKKNNKKRA